MDVNFLHRETWKIDSKPCKSYVKNESNNFKAFFSNWSYSPGKIQFWKWKNCYQKFYGGKLFSLTPLLPPPQNWRPYPSCFMRYEGKEVPKSNISLVSQKQHIFSKNIIRTKIFYVKFSTKIVSTKIFPILTIICDRALKLEWVKKYGVHVSYVYNVHKYTNELTLSQYSYFHVFNLPTFLLGVILPITQYLGNFFQSILFSQKNFKKWIYVA